MMALDQGPGPRFLLHDDAHSKLDVRHDSGSNS